MEPLSALSIATAVIQFLDFTGKVVSGTWQIYRGQPPEETEPNSDVASITTSLQEVTRSLKASKDKASLQPWSSQDTAISKLAESCTEVGEQLLALLNRLRAQSERRVWQSFRTALRTIWSDKDIEKLSQKLENYRQQISMHILIALREQVTSSNHNQWESLSQTQNVCREVLREVTKQAQWQDDIISAIQRSHLQQSRHMLHAAPPAKIHEKLSPADKKRIGRSVLKTMYFPEIKRRYEKITAAYQATFNWVFNHPSGTAEWVDFPKWARDNESPLYWVTGKAGAGKSTLMRHVYDHADTQAALKSWAGDRSLITAFFFFWNSGSSMQMSHEGLIRALLYQILNQAPELVSVVLPHRVEVGALFGEHMIDSEVYAPPWAWEELLQAFRLLIKKCTERYRMAFFIDGMDEFQGNSTVLVDFITSLIAPGTKVCASSRPWVVFEDAFGHRPHLRLENLTHADIKHYVTSKMTASPGFRVLQELDAEISKSLVENVCRKSSGVFLWVTLVTHSLLDGLSEGERLFELQQRLDSLPDDLEKLFERILGRLEGKHFERAAQFFQMVRASLLPLSLLDMSFADEDDSDFAMKAPLGPLTTSHVSSRAELMRRRINACCKGLLEAKPDSKAQLADAKVGYLHRTVKDYLELKETSDKLHAASRPEFNVNLRLYNPQIMRLKCQQPETLDDAILWESITYAIEYAVRSDPACSGHQMALLNEIDKTAIALTTAPLQGGATWLQLKSQGSTEAATYWTWTRVGCRKSKSFLALAVQGQLINYVDGVLQTMPPGQAAREARGLIELASNFYDVFADEWDRPSIHHGGSSEELLNLLRRYESYQEEKLIETVSQADEAKPRSKLWTCFCFK